MALPNPIITYLEKLDSKKNNLRRAILELAVDWKDLDKHLDSTKNSFDECLIDLELKNKDLESNRESLAQQFEELEQREESFRDFHKKQVEGFEMKERELDVTRERLGEFEVREEKLNEQKKSMELLLEKIEREKEEFLGIQISVGEKLNEISLKERNYGDLYKEVILIQDRMEIWAKELGLKEEQNIAMRKLNEERSEELRVIAREHDLKLEKIEEREKFVEEKLKEIGLKERNCESLFKEINLIQKSVEEEFSLREEKVRMMQNINDERSKELGIIAREYDLKLEKIADREKFVEEKLQEIELKERNCENLSREINLIQKSKREEFSLREEKLSTMQKLNEKRSEELEMEKEEFQNIKNICDEKWNEIILKERNCENRCKELDLREEKLKEKQKLNEESFEKITMEKKSTEVLYKNIEKKKEEVEVSRSVEEKLNKISLIKNNFGECSMGLNNRRRELEVVEKQCNFKKGINKSIAKKLNEFSLKEMDCKDLSKEVDLILDPIERQLDIIAPEFVTMDGRALQIYINEHYKDRNISNKVCKILQSSPDPAKLVLDAMEGFYPPYLKKGDIEFKKFIVRKSCVFLLEKLMKLSPFITLHVREAALRLALEWKVKMEAELCSKNYLEILAFLRLLASYKLASYFIADEILKVLELVATRSGVPQICLALGIPEKLPGFIRILVDKGQHLAAVKYVYAFSLLDEFPPIILLESYISHVNGEAKKIHEKGHKSLDTQVIATQQQLNDLKSVLNCVKFHGHPIEDIEAVIERLNIQLLDLRKINQNKRKSFFHDTVSQSEPHTSKKLRSDALSAKATKSNCSEFPIIHPLSQQPLDEYFSPEPSNLIFPNMSQNEPSALSNWGYPPLGFGGSEYFDSVPDYSSRPVPKIWSPIRTPQNL